MKIIAITNLGRFFTREIGNGAVDDLNLRHASNEVVVQIVEVKP